MARQHAGSPAAASSTTRSTVSFGPFTGRRSPSTANERPHVLVTAEYSHGSPVEVVISNIGRGAAENITFEFSAPMESSVSYQRDSEIATVWDSHANLVSLLRDMELQNRITVTSRYEALTGEKYETLWTINSLLMPGNLYAAESGAT